MRTPSPRRRTKKQPFVFSMFPHFSMPHANLHITISRTGPKNLFKVPEQCSSFLHSDPRNEKMTNFHELQFFSHDALASPRKNFEAQLSTTETRYSDEVHSMSLFTFFFCQYEISFAVSPNRYSTNSVKITVNSRLRRPRVPRSSGAA